MGHNPLSVHARARNILTGDPIVGSGSLTHGRLWFPRRDPENGDGTGGDAGQTDEAKAKAAAERGVFGAPAIFIGDQMFFGNDRLDFVVDALRSAT